MTRRRPALVLLVAIAAGGAALALALGGCGFGPGDALKGGARLNVSRDFGHSLLDSAKVTQVRQSDTVMRFLQAAHSKVETRYGGNFVQGIDGLAGDRAARRDWFYYVNGIEADVGASDYSLSPGDRIQWDYHSWRATMRVPAIVGAYPEPLLHGTHGRRLPVAVECEHAGSPTCRDVAKRLGDAGVVATGAAIGGAAGKQVARVLVGRWSAIRRLLAAQPLTDPPARSGVFARFTGSGAGTLEFLNDAGGVARVAPPGTGLVAARAPEGQGPVWLVTGVDDAGVTRAAGALSEAKLHDAFAVAVTPTATVRLPVEPGGG
ncbi:MAG: hypothetical protein QOK25_1715 [Thermoleophilaceae bacterium]|nr:hypothetical protein [Thermoleophilaceae bacterium]